jgi:hypothetical protein
MPHMRREIPATQELNAPSPPMLETVSFVQARYSAALNRIAEAIEANVRT